MHELRNFAFLRNSKNQNTLVPSIQLLKVPKFAVTVQVAIFQLPKLPLRVQVQVEPVPSPNLLKRPKLSVTVQVVIFEVPKLPLRVQVQVQVFCQTPKNRYRFCGKIKSAKVKKLVQVQVNLYHKIHF